MGSQVNESGKRAFTAGEALAIYRRVKFSAGTVVYADAGEKGIGITDAAAPSGDQVPVKLWSFPGTRKIVVNETLSAGDSLYGDDDGKFSNDSSGDLLVQLLEDGSADGSICEAAIL